MSAKLDTAALRESRTYDALALWEAVVDRMHEANTGPGVEPHKYPEMVRAFEEQGWCAIRDQFTHDAIIEPLRAGWEILHAAGQGECFDWIWCPWFLDHCGTWDDYGFTVHANWMELATVKTARKVAERNAWLAARRAEVTP